MRGAAILLVVYLTCIFGTALPASASKRVALVIGNADYKHTAPLKNPKNDADAVSEVLKHLDFEVLKGTDLTHRQFGRTVAKFRRMLAGAEVALFFYAGHGMQMHNSNFLIPVDALLEDEDSLDFEAVQLRTVLGLMEREPRTNLVFLDACRDNPLARNLSRSLGTRSASVGRGFAREETGIGTLIAFATQPGNVALDGGQHKHSPFTKALLKHIETPGQDIANLMRQVRLDVITATSSRQVPWNNSSLTAPFVFKTKPKEDLRAAEIEENVWNRIAASGKKPDYERYLAIYPKGRFVTLARIKLEELKYRKALDAERGRRERERAELERLRQVLAHRQAKDANSVAERKRQGGEQLGAEATRKEQTEKAEAPATYKVAGVPPATTDLPTSVPEPAIDTKAMISALQKELNRVGCNAGFPDGIWGRKGRAALSRFNAHAKQNLRSGEPDEQALKAVRAKKGRVCPASRPSAKKTATVPKKGQPKPVQRQSAVKVQQKPAAKKKVKKDSWSCMDAGLATQGLGDCPTGLSGPWSDRRLKRNIRELVTLDSGIRLYAFQYHWDTRHYVGVLAQELLSNPTLSSAVFKTHSGFYRVDYAKLGLRMVTLESWRSLGVDSVVRLSSRPLSDMTHSSNPFVH